MLRSGHGVPDHRFRRNGPQSSQALAPRVTYSCRKENADDSEKGVGTRQYETRVLRVMSYQQEIARCTSQTRDDIDGNSVPFQCVSMIPVCLLSDSSRHLILPLMKNEETIA